MKEYKSTSYMSQPEFREAVHRIFGNISEEIIKYNYDRYTYYMNVQPIRKKKTRKRVGEEAKWFKLNLKKLI